jgi:MFS transporter, PAT family, beta-lactamase induction signal transducer AmpG
MSKSSNRTLAILGSLYISQYIPMMFIMMGMPVFLREQGLSLDKIGLFSVVALPIALKFLWSPLIDRYSFRRWGHYRFWIICFQLLAALVNIGMAFVDLGSQFTLLFILSLVLCCLCTSQDIATDALAIRTLQPAQRGLGNGIQKAGSYLGGMIGSGGVLLLLNTLGWRNTQFLVAALMVVMLLPILFVDTSADLAGSPPVAKPTQIITPIFTWFKQPGMKFWSLILTLYLLGSSLLWGMLRPFLVDLGLSMADIGLMLGIVSFSAGIPAALVTGLMVKPLGRKRALIYVGLFQASALSTYLIPSFGWKSLPVLYAAAIIAQMGMCSAETVIAVIAMDKSRLAHPGTDYTTQISLMYLSGILAMVLSGFITNVIGYRGLFGLSVGVVLLTVGLIFRNYRDQSHQSSLEYLPATEPDTLAEVSSRGLVHQKKS